MEYFACILLIIFHIAFGAVPRQIQILPGGPVGSFSSTNCDVLCDDEVHTINQICASDGMLYKTQCEYNNAQCKAIKAGDQLTIVSYGACITLNSSCDVVMQTRCVSHISALTGGAMNTNEQVCGSDHKTYATFCEFRSAQCKYQQLNMQTSLDLMSMGKCPVDMSTAIQINCTQYIPTSNLAIEGGATVYPHCSHTVHDTICSMDGVTFSSPCQLCNYAMRRDPTTTLIYAAHKGTCRTIFG